MTSATPTSDPDKLLALQTLDRMMQYAAEEYERYGHAVAAQFCSLTREAARSQMAYDLREHKRDQSSR